MPARLSTRIATRSQQPTNYPQGIHRTVPVVHKNNSFLRKPVEKGVHKGLVFFHRLSYTSSVSFIL
jgi:hypothetical protein